MKGFFTPLLCRVYLLFFLIVAGYGAVLLVEHSPWNKERLLAQLLAGDREQKLEAAVDLVDLRAQNQLLRALYSHSEQVRTIAVQSLRSLWSHAAGPKAFQLTEAAAQAAAHEHYDDALDILSGVIEKYPEFAEGWNRRATLHWQLGHYAESIDDCQRVVQLNPGHFGAWEGMGLCQLKLGQLEEACDSLRHAVRLMPFNLNLRGLLSGVETLLPSYRTPQNRGQLI